MNINTVLLRERFSKASKNYDKLSLIQKQAADELFNRFRLSNSNQKILDIGIGTGYLTQRIKLRYPDLQIYGLDLAFGMLNKTRQKVPQAMLIQADAKDLPFKSETFDTVLSNLAYQWVRDLAGALQQVKKVLKNKGVFYFTIFCENTLRELREVIFELSDSDLKDKQLNPIGNLPNKSTVEELFEQAGFKDIKTNSKISRCYYQNLPELLNWLKLIGANRYWSARFYKGLSGRGFIENITKHYEERFRDKDKIFATFEILFIEAVS